MERSGDWLREARVLAAVSSAVSVAMFAQLAIDAVEVVVVARLGAAALAGVTLAIGLYAVVFLFALGVVTAVTPLAAQQVGRGDYAAARRVGQNGVCVALAVSLPLMLALLAAAAVLPGGVTGRLDAAWAAEVPQAARYLLGAAWGLPGWVVYVAIRCFAIATGRVRVATAIMLAAIPVHAALAVLLALWAGWGAFGAGLAYGLAGYAALGVLALILRAAPPAPDQAGGAAFAAAFRRPFGLDLAECRAILRLGLPFAARIVLREAVLPVAAFGLVPFGADAVAAHGVASRLVMLAGVFSFGFSDAANVRVGMAVGAGVPHRARGSAWLAVMLAAAVSVGAAGLVAAWPGSLATWLLGAGNAAVPMAAAVLPVAAVLLVLEGVQSTASGALSGLRDARFPLAIAILGGWVVGLPAGLFLAAHWPSPAVGLWMGLCAGWLLATGLTFARLGVRLAGLGAGVAAGP